MIKIHKLDYESPIGVMEIKGTTEAITSILFSEKNEKVDILRTETPEILRKCYKQLDEFFKGNRRDFSLPYQLEGTTFQKKVWETLTKIPYGYTTSYKEIAFLIGNQRAIRAVGSANGKNKLGIIIPCHRIIGSNGMLCGYAGGLWRKEWLLHHEKTFNK